MKPEEQKNLTNSKQKKLTDIKTLIERLQSERTPDLARNQPCGCVICICNNEDMCFGCSARNCGTHPIGEIPNPVYEDLVTGPLDAGMAVTLKAIDDVFEQNRHAEKIRSFLAVNGQYWSEFKPHLTLIENRVKELADSIIQQWEKLL